MGSLILGPGSVPPLPPLRGCGGLALLKSRYSPRLASASCPLTNCGFGTTAEFAVLRSGWGELAPRRLLLPRREPLLPDAVGIGGDTPATGPEFSPYTILWGDAVSLIWRSMVITSEGERGASLGSRSGSRQCQPR